MRVRLDPGTIGGAIRWGLLWLAAVAALFLILTRSVWAGGWSDNPKIQEWLQSTPVHTCCAAADGFLSDEYDRVRPGEGGHTEGGVIAHITDNDDDPPCWEWYDEENDMRGTACRRKVPQQRDYFVPESLIVYLPQNPTGHGVLFLPSGGTPKCYFLPSGA
jgi:hypothetical protein